MSRRFLIVDDSEVDRLVFRDSFERVADRANLDEATSADGALTLLARNRYDAIVLDIKMPGRDGFHVLRAIRATAHSNWPIVVMWSSSAHPDDVERSYEDRANFYVRKPISLDGVQQMVESCLAMVELSERPDRAQAG